MSRAVESIGASSGVFPLQVKVFLSDGLRIRVCGVPFQVHDPPSKAVLTDHVPSLFPLFLKVISTVKVSDGALSTTPLVLLHANEAADELSVPKVERIAKIAIVAVAKDNNTRLLLILSTLLQEISVY
jgi:hypothetical protein